MNEFLTQRGLSVELPEAKAMIREVETRCKKCGHTAGDFLPWGEFRLMSRKDQRRYLKKIGECNHDWQDIVIREYDALSPLAGLPRI